MFKAVFLNYEEIVMNLTVLVTHKHYKILLKDLLLTNHIWLLLEILSIIRQ